MAVINDPNDSTKIVRVGAFAYTPAHVAPGPFPIGAGGAYKVSAVSGTMAAALAANSEIVQFRYVTAASRVCTVHSVMLSATILTLPGLSTTVASGPYQFRATMARAWTAAGSGGTRFVLTGNQAKLRTSFATSEVNDAGIATTGALTVGTKTLDTQDIGSITSSFMLATAAGAGDTTIVDKAPLFGWGASNMPWPITLANQEGFVVRIGAAFPATMTWNFAIDILWSELDAF